MKNRFLLFFCLFLFRLNDTPAQIKEPGIAIVGAFRDEVELLISKIEDKQVYNIRGISFFTGKLGGKSVVLVKSGVGKVNAAMTMTLLLEKFNPQQVIFSGVAGGLNPGLAPADIVIAEKTALYDFGKLSNDTFTYWSTSHPETRVENPLFFPADSVLLKYAKIAATKVALKGIETNLKPKIIGGIVVTGDMFVASSAKKNTLVKDLKADATEMEGAAIAQVCYEMKIACLIIRSLSDSADENAHLDFNKFKAIAAENSANLIIETLRLL